jgi:hypothetical protein
LLTLSNETTIPFDLLFTIFFFFLFVSDFCQWCQQPQRTRGGQNSFGSHTPLSSPLLPRSGTVPWVQRLPANRWKIAWVVYQRPNSWEGFLADTGKRKQIQDVVVVRSARIPQLYTELQLRQLVISLRLVVFLSRGSVTTDYDRASGTAGHAVDVKEKNRSLSWNWKAGPILDGIGCNFS